MGGQAREMGSTTVCYISSLGSYPDISQNNKMGEISKEVAKHTQARQIIFKQQ
jgi:hypothetical protein